MSRARTLTQQQANVPHANASVGGERPERGQVFADRGLMARTGVAFLLANLRYWLTVAPHVRAQLSRWGHRAQRIADPVLGALAMEKLHEERFNVELSATLATLAPRAHRERVAEAIVALQVMYDYLDLLTEQTLEDPLRDGRCLFEAFTDAVTPESGHGADYYRHHPSSEDGGYLEELVDTVRLAFAQLPASDIVAEVAQRSARRCAQALTRAHAVPTVGVGQLEQWASEEASGTRLQWQEFLAGAEASVLAVHALIAAAAERSTTREDAVALDGAYLSIGALTMLDSLIDRQQDLDAGRPAYIQYYGEDLDLLAVRLESVARGAAAEARALPHGAHHVMTLVGIVAYYSSAPAAGSDFARPVITRVCQGLKPLITPTLALMRAWRGAKRIRRGRTTGDQDV